MTQNIYPKAELAKAIEKLTNVFRGTARPSANPLLADAIADFNTAEGDKIGLSRGLSEANLVFEAFDSNGDGTVDATLVKLGSNSNNGILAIVKGTVDAAGATTLTNTDFISVTSQILTLN